MKHKFYRISYAKIQEGIFVGHQISELIENRKLEDNSDVFRNSPVNASKTSSQIFWVIVRVTTLELVNELLIAYNALSCNMSQTFLRLEFRYFPGDF